LAGSTLEQREQALAVREQQIAYREQQVAHKENILNSLLEKLEYTINLAMQDKEELLIKHLPDPSTATQVPQPWNTSDGLSEYLAASTASSEVLSRDPVTPGQTSTSEDAASQSSDQVASLTSSIQQLQSVQAETATQLWYEPYGTDIELLAKDAYGNLVSLPLHRSIVEPRSGWVREHISLALHNRCNLGADDDEGATQKKAILLELDMESSVATACFFFAYTRGKSIHTEMNSQSPGEELLKSCSPNLAHNFNLSPIHSCIHMYDAALKLRMPELCCYLLEQMEILATNVAESACVQRVRGPRFSIREVKNALEGAMAFLYTAEKQVQWRPMQVAFAALYDAVALRVGPSLYPTHSEEMKNLVRKLHEDHIEYRQLQRSCLPRPGSLVPSSHEMGRLLTRAEDPSYLWHGCDLHHDLYSDGGIHRLRNQSSTYRAQNRDRKKGPPRSGSMLSDVSVDIQL
jgi:hypothetical protein